MSAKALDGKTPYEMLNKSKLYLGGIQEFRTAAYIKDLKAGKLDARVQQGHFIGYDSESKGYRIYWLTKRLVSVERNVVFNENDILEKENTTVTVGVQSEGENEKEKVIQHPENVNEVESQAQKKTNLRTKKTNPYQQKQLIQYNSHPVQNLKPKLKVKKNMKYSSTDEVIIQESKKEHTEI